MITNVHKNSIGTTDFDGLFSGMRKAQDFIVYPMRDASQEVSIQSDTRFGTINLETGVVTLCKPRPGGANTISFMQDQIRRKLVTDVATSDELKALKDMIRSTGGALVGNSMMLVENAGALAV